MPESVRAVLSSAGQKLDDLSLLLAEPLPDGLTEQDAKRRLWRDLQALPKLLQ